MERGSINSHTPLEWLHVRIEPVGEEIYSLRTYLGNGKFHPIDMKAMHLVGKKTENLSKAEAIALGGRMEKWLRAQNAK